MNIGRRIRTLWCPLAWLISPPLGVASGQASSTKSGYTWVEIVDMLEAGIPEPRVHSRVSEACVVGKPTPELLRRLNELRVSPSFGIDLMSKQCRTPKPAEPVLDASAPSQPDSASVAPPPRTSGLDEPVPKVTAPIPAISRPNGAVVAEDSLRTYVTNLFSGDPRLAAMQSPAADGAPRRSFETWVMTEHPTLRNISYERRLKSEDNAFATMKGQLSWRGAWGVTKTRDVLLLLRVQAVPNGQWTVVEIDP